MSREAPAPTDRGMWLVVARRDFLVRLRDRGFVVSTAITLAVLSIFILLRAYGGGGMPSYDLGVVGSSVTANATVAIGHQQGVDVRLHVYPDMAGAQAALEAGQVDAVLKSTLAIGLTGNPESSELIGSHAVPPQLATRAQAAALSENIKHALQFSKIPDAQLAQVLDPRSVHIETLQPPDPNREANAAVAFIAVLLAYGQLFGYGVWVATGVIEEKASRVVEILLSAIRPRQLLGASRRHRAVRHRTARVHRDVRDRPLGSPVPSTCRGRRSGSPSSSWAGSCGLRVLRGAVRGRGSLVSRMEELQNAMVPINL